MGLLDDAIREHLDLKRRRGADPAEVERAEREALGPVRRGPEGPAPGELDLEEPFAYDHEEEEDWAERSADASDELTFQQTAEREPLDAGEPQWAEEPSIPERPASRAEPADLEEPPEAYEPFRENADRAATPPPHPAPASPPPAHGAGRAGETVEYEVEAALEQEQRGDNSEDVLEETPDFLQDTPDHDRLWFEQRPPRDFDFDG
jgi:hypothetical protein